MLLSGQRMLLRFLQDESAICHCKGMGMGLSFRNVWRGPRKTLGSTAS